MLPHSRREDNGTIPPGNYYSSVTHSSAEERTMELYPQVTTIVVILVGELIAIVMLPHSRREGNGTIVGEP